MSRPLNTVVSPVIYKDKFLLIKRIKPPYIGFWCLPGGKVEFGENIEEAVKREIKEEAGLKVKFAKAKGIVEEFLYEKGKIYGHYLIFVCETRTTSGKFQTSEEGELKWFSKEDLKKYEKQIIPSDFAMIKTFFFENPRFTIYRSIMKAARQNYLLSSFEPLDNT